MSRRHGALALAASVSVSWACASPPPVPVVDTVPPAGCGQDGPRGDAALFTNSRNVKIDPPKQCGRGSYIRVYGQGSRRFAMGHEASKRACSVAPGPDAPSDVCPEIFSDAFGRAVIQRLSLKGIQTTGLGLGACGRITGGFDDWHMSVSVADWAHVEEAVLAVSDELHLWGAGHHFGVTVRGIPCAVPE